MRAASGPNWIVDALARNVRTHASWPVYRFLDAQVNPAVSYFQRFLTRSVDCACSPVRRGERERAKRARCPAGQCGGHDHVRRRIPHRAERGAVPAGPLRHPARPARRAAVPARSAAAVLAAVVRLQES